MSVNGNKKCPYCGESIKEKAIICKFCKKNIDSETLKVENNYVNCPYCYESISSGAASCSHCDSLINHDNSSSNNNKKKLEKTSSAKPKFNRIYIFVSILLVVTVSIFIHQQQRNVEKALITSTEEYRDTLDMVLGIILEDAMEAEKQIVLTSRVWNNSIRKTRDRETDKYTLKGGGIEGGHPINVFHDDFNESLLALYSDTTVQLKIAGLEAGRVAVSEIMKQLQNPPEEYIAAHATLLDLYMAYSSLIEMAINPSGNLTTFNSTKNERVNEFTSFYRRLETQLP